MKPHDPITFDLLRRLACQLTENRLTEGERTNYANKLRALADKLEKEVTRKWER